MFCFYFFRTFASIFMRAQDTLFAPLPLYSDTLVQLSGDQQPEQL